MPHGIPAIHRKHTDYQTKKGRHGEKPCLSTTNFHYCITTILFSTDTLNHRTHLFLFIDAQIYNIFIKYEKYFNKFI